MNQRHNKQHGNTKNKISGITYIKLTHLNVLRTKYYLVVVISYQLIL